MSALSSLVSLTGLMGSFAFFWFPWLRSRFPKQLYGAFRFVYFEPSDAPITVLAVIAAMAVHDSSDGMQWYSDSSDSSGLGMGGTHVLTIFRTFWKIQTCFSLVPFCFLGFLGDALRNLRILLDSIHLNRAMYTPH